MVIGFLAERRTGLALSQRDWDVMVEAGRPACATHFTPTAVNPGFDADVVEALSMGRKLVALSRCRTSGGDAFPSSKRSV